MILSVHLHTVYGVEVTTVNVKAVSLHVAVEDLTSSFYDDEFSAPSFEATRKKQVKRYNCCNSSSLGAACRGSADPRKSEARKSRLKK